MQCKYFLFGGVVTLLCHYLIHFQFGTGEFTLGKCMIIASKLIKRRYICRCNKTQSTVSAATKKINKNKTQIKQSFTKAMWQKKNNNNKNHNTRDVSCRMNRLINNRQGFISMKTCMDGLCMYLFTFSHLLIRV